MSAKVKPFYGAGVYGNGNYFHWLRHASSPEQALHNLSSQHAGELITC